MEASVCLSAARPLGLVSLAPFLATDIPPARAIIAPWLHDGEVALLHADAGVGKTWFALTLALIASKQATAFDYTGAGVPVLYVDGEMGEHDLQGRLRTLCKVLGVTDPSQGGDFRLLSRSLAKEDKLSDFPDLCSPQGQDTICNIANAMNAGLVVLDNYRTLASVDDENDATAYQDLNRFLKRLARRRAVLGVHHNNKQSRMSGSTALETVLSHRFNLTRATPKAAGQACFTVKLEKNRTGLGGSTAAPTKCELSANGWGWGLDDDCIREEFRAEAEAHRFGSQGEAARRFGVTERTIRNWVQAIVAAGHWKPDTWRNLVARVKAIRAAQQGEGPQEDASVSDADTEVFDF